jgi:hypothetical protein
VCGTDSTCHGCTSHAQCSSSVCLADGSCSDETNVAYVQSDGTGSAPCTKAAPCGTLDDALNTTKPIVKIATGLVKGTKTTSINNKTVTIVADAGATLTRGLFDGAILEVRGNSDVKIFDLDITGAVGAGADGIDLMAAGSPSLSLTRAKVDNNQGIGISATGGTLIVSQTTVSGNTGAGISATGGTLRVTCSTIGGTAVNTGGGISISGAQFDLANNFIVSNGGPLAVFGGVKIDGIATSTGVHRLEFNTITANQTSGTLTAGVLCSAIAMPLTFANNIVFRNGSGMQVEGNGCVWNYSDIGQAITGLADINADPLFVNAAQGDFHIQATSPARDAADPRSTEGVDFDGDARPQDVHSDMGADERKP